MATLKSRILSEETCLKMMKKRIKIVVYSILGVLVAFWLIKGSIEYVRFDREYFADGYHCNAVVTRVTGILGSKPSNYYRHVNYKYEYQNVIYDGDCKIDDRHKMKVGDSIEIIVSRVNPE